MQNVRKGIEGASAIFAVLFVGVVAMSYIIQFMVQSLSMMIMDPFNFVRYALISAFVFYGLYHAYTWLFNDDQYKK